MKDIIYVGVQDTTIDLFEAQFPVEDGITYNSYLIIDEKVALMDTVDQAYTNQWLDNLKDALKGRDIDYLVVHHMEPDHSASIRTFLEAYPNAEVILSMQAGKMLNQFFPECVNCQRRIVKEGDILSLGEHELEFIGAPMVHWPEVLFSYDKKEKVLFSADAFGTFGIHTTKEIENWKENARRYYFGIVGKFGMQVQAVLKKLAGKEIKTICSLHGPILDDNLDDYLNLYDTWSCYEAENKGVTIAYTSVYGHTKEAVRLLQNELEKKNVEVNVFDLCRIDSYEALAYAFKNQTLVLATTTYNTTIYPVMEEFIHHLIHRDYKKRNIIYIENGSWAPMAKKVMMKMMESLKDLHVLGEMTILSAVNDDNKIEIKELANQISMVDKK